MYPYLVADVGGTNARFAVVTGKITNGDSAGESAISYQLQHITKLNGSDYPSFSAALRAYLKLIDIECPKYACVAVAGPVSGCFVKMTNLPWQISGEDLVKEFKLKAFELLNDFAAVAVSTSELKQGQLQSIKSGSAVTDGNKATLGPGTGLGVAGLVRANNVWQPVPSEGGHVNISPASPLECEVVAAGMARHGHVSAETFVSGPGLVNLYQALAEVRGEQAMFSEPHEISSAAIDDKASLSGASLSLFCSFLGSLSGNLALTYGAKGGVYLAGGILPRFVDFFCESDFVQRFSDKGVMSDYLKDIPVSLISYEYCAFLGAAAWLDQRVRRVGER